MIRQAISCDICATEKRQTNHWFVAYEQNGELRISGWSSRHRQRPGSKHLCGQICLHKLVDEFMAKSIAVRPPRAADADEAAAKATAAVDASLTSRAAYGEPESPARLQPPPESIPPQPISRPQPGLVTIPSWPHSQNLALQQGDKPRSVSRNWRAEAWERERERELRAIENRPDFAERRRTSA